MALCEETIYQIALTRIKGMNLLLAKTLLDTIGSASGIFKEKGQNLQNICKLQTPVFSDESIKTAIETAKREIDFIEKNHIIPLFFSDSEYPARLNECIDAPILLYYRITDETFVKFSYKNCPGGSLT